MEEAGKEKQSERGRKICENRKGEDRMRILIAEDEKDLNQILAQRLETEHYSVDSCMDGEEALDYLAGAEYDVVILDIMMPKKDGLVVLREIRQKNKSVPAFF